MSQRRRNQLSSFYHSFMIEPIAAIQKSLKSLNFIKKNKRCSRHAGSNVCKVHSTAIKCVQGTQYSEQMCARYIVQRANVCKVHRTAIKCVQGTQYSDQMCASTQYSEQMCARYIVQRANVCKVHSTAIKCVQGTEYSDQMCARYTVQRSNVCKVHSTAIKSQMDNGNVL